MPQTLLKPTSCHLPIPVHTPDYRRKIIPASLTIAIVRITEMMSSFRQQQSLDCCKRAESVRYLSHSSLLPTISCNPGITNSPSNNMVDFWITEEEKSLQFGNWRWFETEVWQLLASEEERRGRRKKASILCSLPLVCGSPELLEDNHATI